MNFLYIIPTFNIYVTNYILFYKSCIFYIFIFTRFIAQIISCVSNSCAFPDTYSIPRTNDLPFFLLLHSYMSHLINHSYSAYMRFDACRRRSKTRGAAQDGPQLLPYTQSAYSTPGTKFLIQ